MELKSYLPCKKNINRTTISHIIRENRTQGLIHLLGGQGKHVWLIIRQLPTKAGWWDAPLALWNLAMSNLHIYGSWDKKCNRHNFLSFWSILCSFTPLTTQEIKILKKWKKTLEIALFYINTWIHEYINLHKFIRTINDNHMMYGSWDMKHDRQNFWSFWAISYTFTPLTTPKIKIL